MDNYVFKPYATLNGRPVFHANVAFSSDYIHIFLPVLQKDALTTKFDQLDENNVCQPGDSVPFVIIFATI